jgi:hypothetical protein
MQMFGLNGTKLLQKASNLKYKDGASVETTRPVGVKNVIWGVYVIWVASTYLL